MWSRVAVIAVAILVLACASRTDQAPASRPAIGLAVKDSIGGWCAEFPADSGPAANSIATLVFVGDSAHVSTRVRVRARRSRDCDTAFPQPRWTSYAAYDLEVIDSRGALPYLAIIVGTDARWTRGDRGAIRGDIDGDGTTEELRRCAADEGEHFTVWSFPSGGTPVRRAHEYFDWGAIVDRTCATGDDGR